MLNIFLTIQFSWHLALAAHLAWYSKKSLSTFNKTSINNPKKFALEIQNPYLSNADLQMFCFEHF